MKHLIIILCFMVLFSSCGYNYGRGTLPPKYQTISIPYVDGDNTGNLTAALVREVSRSGAFKYKKDCGDLILHVRIIDCHLENVGFRYDHKTSGKRNHSIIPTETRVKVLAEVSVTDGCSCCTVLGPAKIYASADFDHHYYDNPDDRPDAVNIFSLGQLTDYDAAYDVAQDPLNKVLAQKIVDYVIHSW